MVAVDDIERAAQRIDGVRVRTPLLQSAALDRAVGGRVLIKPENLQVTGSFKIRGAYNRLSRLTPERAGRGVVAWSSGNHAQGVAAAASRLGIAATIVMPADAPRLKLENTRRLGGDVVLYDRYREDREAIAKAIAAERGAALVPSYDHPDIVAGQGTVGLEIAEQAAELGCSPDCVVIPCGGGGLSSGSALALTDRLPGVSVYAVEPQAFDDTARSMQSGRRERVAASARSICDALQTPSPGRLTFDINRRLLAGVLTVTDDEVRAAMQFAFRHLKLVVEPGGAVALAAALSDRVPSAAKTTAIVISGGNVDPDVFAALQADPA